MTNGLFDVVGMVTLLVLEAAVANSLNVLWSDKRSAVEKR